MTTININLLGIEQKERNRSRVGIPVDRGILIAAVSVIGALVITVGGTFVMDGLLAAAEADKVRLGEEIQALEGKLGEIKNIHAKKETALAEQRILEYVTGRTYSWSRFMNEVRDITPDSLWIETIAVAAETLTLSGNTFDHQTVAFFLANMQASPLFETVTLTGSNKSIGKDGTGVHFTMTAKLKFDVAAAGASDVAAAAVPAGSASDAPAKPGASGMSRDSGANASKGAEALKGSQGAAAAKVGG
ncbi:MAG: PilN domain-containing protein [Candidatus Sericytochromatia bacterium]|nr:PilN domain-containing protein [Candidatus Sericytochromatia bacterium]